MKKKLRKNILLLFERNYLTKNNISIVSTSLARGDSFDAKILILGSLMAKICYCFILFSALYIISLEIVKMHYFSIYFTKILFVSYLH
jgi:hypothetical protein